MDGLRGVDGLLLAHRVLSDVPHQDVFGDHRACLVAVDPLVGDRLTLELLAELPHLVTGSRCVALVQAGLARRLPAGSGVRSLPCPWDAVPLLEALWWHPVYQADPEHAWLRAVVTQAGARLPPGIGGTDTGHKPQGATATRATAKG